jgi:DNA-binding transcriptional ArsR family regulator
MNEKIDSTWQARWGQKALSEGVTVIPTAFLKHAGRAGLNAAQQILLIHLISYWWGASERPFPSLATLRDRTGMSEKTIGQHLKKLEEKLWISRQRRYNKSYKYDLDRLARRVSWLAGDQTAMSRPLFHPKEGP